MDRAASARGGGTDANRAPEAARRVPRYGLGVLWAGLNAASSVLLPFAMFVFFAREIPPSVLGLAALATACTELFKSVALPGVYEALLQQKHDVERCHEATLAILLAAGTLAMPCCLLTLYVLGHLVPGLRAHLLVLAPMILRIPLDLATLQPQAMLVRRLDFRRLALRAVLANILAGVAGILVALLARPLAGLVCYGLLQSLLTFGSTAIGGGLLARPRLHRDCCRSLRREGLLSTGNRTLAAGINYVDQVVMAPLAGEVGLAYYNLGKRLETTFVTVGGSFSSILFQPLFAADGALPRQAATRRALLVLTVFCGAPATVIFADAPRVIALLFGPRWIAAAPVVAWLSMNGLIRAVGMIPGSLLSVSGRNRELLATSIASAVGSLLAVAALASTSIAVCAAVLAGKNLLIVAAMAWLARDEVRRPLWTYAAFAAAPALLMLLAAAAAPVPEPAFLPSIVRDLVPLAVSGLAALLAGGAFIGFAHLLARRFQAPIPVPVPVPIAGACA